MSTCVRIGPPAASARATLTVRPPSDKAILQRAVVLAALASSRSTVAAEALGTDVRRALACLRRLGVDCIVGRRTINIDGVGLYGLRSVADRLDVGNSATLARLLTAVLAGQPGGDTVVTGNGLLRARPMDWLVQPLRAMGGNIHELGAPGRLPLAIHGNGGLVGVSVAPRVASAQAKSALLYAGLLAEGATTVVQRFPTRDHTQRLLRHFGVDVRDDGGATTVQAPARMLGRQVHVPADISSAAPLVAATALLPRKGTVLRLVGIGVNPTRSGFVGALQSMGADVAVEQVDADGPEPVGELIVCSGRPLRGTIVEGGELVQSLIDEVPLLCAVAACADGETRIRDCGELRDKDTNRLETTVRALRAFGVQVEAGRDELVVCGDRSRLRGAHVPATRDHRVAMAASALAAVLPQPSVLEDADCVAVSYPAFYRDLARLTDVASA